MIIYKIVNSWNFDSSPNYSILKICYCSKLKIFRNLEITNFCNFQNKKFVEFYKLYIFGIFQINTF